MKKLLVLAALTMAAAPAMASKARLSSLGNASHLVDTQTLFVNPADLNYVGDFATLEMGDNKSTYSATDVTRAPKAEGGFVRTTSFGKVGAYLGHRNDTTTSFIDGVNVSTFAVGGANGTLMTEQNPLDLFYGNDFGGMKWGFDFHYSNAKNDTATVSQKANTMGLSAGVRTDVWNAYARLGLMGKTESDVAALQSPKLESKGLYKVGGGYWFDSIYAFANYEYAKGTATVSNADTDITKNQYEVGMVNNHKVEGGNFFYGISYLSNEVKQDSTTSKKTSTSGLPFLVGMELDAASWLTLRGSVKQTVIVGENKNETANTKSNLTNDTTVAVGAGLKWGKIELDGSLAGSTTGAVNGNSLLADASLTYMF
ncbi:hypothetical protein [Bdellovibrio svalbardensis]|uniref:Major outer membrane protein n=1 Tax=Bdellovibrio svalbardensis TaxID=2972972 RepID=A0ABT6DKQ5_9BACT|nr:hypothetical protein [Bdellovibrio svalbardensis]MDG0817097.1 hypothetical protein [Bdellovibrio svalbardensis]